jgi:V-type H+-transporting ATPase subunit a
LILLLVLFGYMDVMIILKWNTDFKGREHEAPSIVTSMIDVFLNGGVVPPGLAALVGDRDTQRSVSVAFVLIALVTIPWMLIPKPAYAIWQAKMEEALKKESEEGLQLSSMPAPDNGDEEEAPLVEKPQMTTDRNPSPI